MFKTEENKDPLPFTNSKTTLTCTYKSGFVLSITGFEGVNPDNPDKVFRCFREEAISAKNQEILSRVPLLKHIIITNLFGAVLSNLYSISVCTNIRGAINSCRSYSKYFYIAHMSVIHFLHQFS